MCENRASSWQLYGGCSPINTLAAAHTSWGREMRAPLMKSDAERLFHTVYHFGKSGEKPLHVGPLYMMWLKADDWLPFHYVWLGCRLWMEDRGISFMDTVSLTHCIIHLQVQLWILFHEFCNWWSYPFMKKFKLKEIRSDKIHFTGYRAVKYKIYSNEKDNKK